MQKKHTPVLFTMCLNSKSFNPIFTKKYTDHLTIIRNNYNKFHLDKSFSSYSATCLRRTDRQTDGWTHDICIP